ncbi:putative reverse transcriptase domain-containing protein [Tanacetum coccineum]
MSLWGMDWCQSEVCDSCHENGVRDTLEVMSYFRCHGETFVDDTPRRHVNSIDLVHGATPVAKSPYRLAPWKCKELSSSQLRELQDKVGGALSRKERVKSRRVRGMILAAQSEAFKQENVLLVGSIMDEAHASRYLVHPRADKTYYILGDMYWLPCVEKDIATYVSNYRICLKGEGCNVKDFWLVATT